MKRQSIPRTFEEAMAGGWRVCEEEYTGELQRSGHLALERIHRESGDRERISVPFTAVLKVGRPRQYRLDRHAYLTPQEAKRFTSAAGR